MGKKRKPYRRSIVNVEVLAENMFYMADDADVSKEEAQTVLDQVRRSPYDTAAELCSIFEQEDERRIDGVRFCVVDEEFETWCLQNQKKVSHDSVLDYLNAMTDETALRLMHKHGLDVQYAPAALSIALEAMVGCVGNHYAMSESTITCLRKYLERIYGKGNVSVPGAIMTATSLFTRIDEIVEIARQDIESGNPRSVSRWPHQVFEDLEVFAEEGEDIVRGLDDIDPPKDVVNIQEIKNGMVMSSVECEEDVQLRLPVMAYYIPFVVKSVLSSAVLFPNDHSFIHKEKRKDDIRLRPWDVLFTEDFLDFLGLSGVPTIENTRFADKLSEELYKQTPYLAGENGRAHIVFLNKALSFEDCANDFVDFMEDMEDAFYDFDEDEDDDDLFFV